MPSSLAFYTNVILQIYCYTGCLFRSLLFTSYVQNLIWIYVYTFSFAAFVLLYSLPSSLRVGGLVAQFFGFLPTFFVGKQFFLYLFLLMRLQQGSVMYFVYMCYIIFPVLQPLCCVFFNKKPRNCCAVKFVPTVHPLYLLRQFIFIFVIFGLVFFFFLLTFLWAGSFFGCLFLLM